MSEVGYVGGSLNFSRMYESREVKDARDISRSEKTEESPQITDEKRREAAIASGIKVGTVVNTTA